MFITTTASDTTIQLFYCRKCWSIFGIGRASMFGFLTVVHPYSEIPLKHQIMERKINKNILRHSNAPYRLVVRLGDLHITPPQ